MSKEYYGLDVLSGEKKAAQSRGLQIKRVKKIEARRKKTKPETKKQRKTKEKKKRVVTDKFLDTYEWRKLRYRAILKYGRTCGCCGKKPPEININVDHIKPRKKYPMLALDINNLQILCHECNHGKGNWDETDWR